MLLSCLILAPLCVHDTYAYYSALLLSILHAQKQFTEWWWDQLLIFTHKFNNTKEPCSYMTHGEEEAQTKEEKRKEPCPPPRHTSGCTFFLFYTFRGGRRNRRKQHEEDMKELCPNTTHGEEEADESTNREKSCVPPSQHIDKTFF